MNVEDLRRLPERPKGVSFNQWLRGLNDLQLVEYAAKCMVDYFQAEEEQWGAHDCFMETMHLLHARETLFPSGEVLGRYFEHWLSDPREQENFRLDREAQAEAQQLLDEMRKKREEEQDG